MHPQDRRRSGLPEGADLMRGVEPRPDLEKHIKTASETPSEPF